MAPILRHNVTSEVSEERADVSGEPASIGTISEASSMSDASCFDVVMCFVLTSHAAIRLLVKSTYDVCYVIM